MTPGKQPWASVALRAILIIGVSALTSACTDLDIANPNAPDSDKALADVGDVGALISTAYNTWFRGSYDVPGTSGPATPGLFLSNQTFQHAPPWSNHGMERYGRLPRVGITNAKTDPFYGNVEWVWVYSYRALSALANGLKALEDPRMAQALGPEDLLRYRAYGRFVQGLAHASIAALYARGFALDETTNLEDPQELLDYSTLMEVALGYFDEAIELALSSESEIPFPWMQADLASVDLVRVAHSYKARFRAQVARTPGERGDVDWNAVLADVEAGIQANYLTVMDWATGWENGFLGFATFSFPWESWTQLPYFMYGMADQSGRVEEWWDLPLDEKSYNLPDGRPVLIITPDLRFPQGSSVAEQRAQEGLYFRILSTGEEGDNWRRPDRGSWRWSWYKPGYGRGFDYFALGVLEQPEITLAEMRLLKAEALFRLGDPAGTAALVNETRTAAGLSPTDAAGANPECVPRLPDGSCGALWEMLKWEKRMETVWTGLAGANWFLDGRGWGDLWKDTPLQLPVPCGELEILLMTPCRSFGGPGGEMGSPGSSYQFPFEEGGAA